MADHFCDKCNRGILRRSERKGVWELHVLPKFGRFPWRCNVCHVKVNLADRGGVKRVRSSRAAESVDLPEEQYAD